MANDVVTVWDAAIVGVIVGRRELPGDWQIILTLLFTCVRSRLGAGAGNVAWFVGCAVLVAVSLAATCSFA